MNYIVYLQRTLTPRKADSLKTLPLECSQIKIGLPAHWVGGQNLSRAQGQKTTLPRRGEKEFILKI